MLPTSTSSVERAQSITRPTPLTPVVPEGPPVGHTVTNLSGQSVPKGSGETAASVHPSFTGSKDRRTTQGRADGRSIRKWHHRL